MTCSDSGGQRSRNSRPWRRHPKSTLGLRSPSSICLVVAGQDDRGWSMYIDSARSWFIHAGRHTHRTQGGIGPGSTVGVQLDLNRRTVSFYVNGERQGTSCAGHDQLPVDAVFYPAVSLNRNVQITLQTGLRPHVVSDDEDQRWLIDWVKVKHAPPDTK